MASPTRMTSATLGWSFITVLQSAQADQASVRSASPGRGFLGRGAKVQRIAEVLQLPVVIERGRPSSLEPQALQEIDLFHGRAAAQRWVTQEFLEAGLFLEAMG